MPPHLIRVVQIVVGSLLAVLLLLAGLGALLPRTWHVEQSISINAPAASVHAWVNDLARWPHWAQWNQSALSPQNQISDPSSGPGARLQWHATGDGEASSGEVRIVRSDPRAGVWFESRVQGSSEPSRASVTYQERPGVTLVIWRDSGQLPPIIGGLFRDLFQKRLGQHMATGLERLKDLVEQRGDAPASETRP